MPWDTLENEVSCALVSLHPCGAKNKTLPAGYQRPVRIYIGSPFQRVPGCRGREGSMEQLSS